MTRRAMLSGLGGLATVKGGAASSTEAQPPGDGEPPRAFADKSPITGKAGPGLEPFDEGMLQIMDRHGVPGAALAIARDGKLVLAKGYGWANAHSAEPAQPETLFSLASLSKSLTAVATLKLVEDGKLSLDDRVIKFVKGIRLPAGARTDPRLANVTVRHCLHHTGGWDRGVGGDPINWEPQICRALQLRPPLSPAQFLAFTLTLRLDFDPGTASKYSNVGYVILGEAIAHASGQTYDRYVTEKVLKPMGISRATLHPREGKYMKGEAHRHLAGSLTPLPPMRLPMVNAAGGWTASVVDLARFLTNLDGSRGTPVLAARTRKLMLEAPPPPVPPRPDGNHVGLGWDLVAANEKAFTYAKDGSYQGVRTFMKRLPTGVNWALLYNASMEFDPHDAQVAAGTVHEVRHLIEKLEKYPDIDLFTEYR
jgi:CubicO group peptidase (beta-lactamase class C family)